jgi:hypothetical protein
MPAGSGGPKQPAQQQQLLQQLQIPAPPSAGDHKRSAQTTAGSSCHTQPSQQQQQLQVLAPSSAAAGHPQPFIQALQLQQQVQQQAQQQAILASNWHAMAASGPYASTLIAQQQLGLGHLAINPQVPGALRGLSVTAGSSAAYIVLNSMLPLQLQQLQVQQQQQSFMVPRQFQGQVQQQQQQQQQQQHQELQQFGRLQGPSTSTGLTWGKRQPRLPGTEQAVKKKRKGNTQQQEQQQQGGDLMLQQLQLPPSAVRSVLPSGLFSCQGMQQDAAVAIAAAAAAEQSSPCFAGCGRAPSCKQMPSPQGQPLQQRSPLLQSGLFSCQGMQEAAAATGADVQQQQQDNHHQQPDEIIPVGDEDCAGVPLGRLQQQMHDYASELQLMQQQLGLGSAEVDAPQCIVAGAQPKPKQPVAAVTPASQPVVADQTPPAAAAAAATETSALHLACTGGKDEEHMEAPAPDLDWPTDVVGMQEVAWRIDGADGQEQQQQQSGRQGVGDNAMEVDVGERCKQQQRQPPAPYHLQEAQEVPAATAIGAASHAAAEKHNHCSSVVLPAALQDLSQQLSSVGPQQPEQLQQVLRNAAQQLLVDARQQQRGAPC